MQFPNHIFRAYDIRGRTPDEFNVNTCYAIGWVLAKMTVSENGCSWHLGFDGRHSSAHLAGAMAQGMHDAGSKVVCLGLCPTPLLYFATMNHAQQCGVMVTGSHNPPEYNGCKITLHGISLAGEEITNLHTIMQDVPIPQLRELDQYQLAIDNIENEYLSQITNRCKMYRPLRVVVDCGNGAAGTLVPALIEALGCEVTRLYCDIDGDFPHHHPDPSKPENLRDLQQEVIAQQADIGLAFDGDGDRLGIVTNTGEIIFPDRALMLFADDLLSRLPHATVLLDVKCSPLVVEHIRGKGGKAILSPTGHSLIKREMKKHGALLAGEMSGHLFFGENWNGCDDALLAAAKLLSILSVQPFSSSELFSRYPSWIGTAEIHLSTSEARKWQIVESIKRSAHFDQAQVSTIDGIRVEFSDCWGIMRASNTTPTLVLRFEGATQMALDRVQFLFRYQLQAVAPDIDVSKLR